MQVCGVQHDPTYCKFFFFVGGGCGQRECDESQGGDGDERGDPAGLFD